MIANLVIVLVEIVSILFFYQSIKHRNLFKNTIYWTLVDKRLEDESADIIKKLFPDTTEQDDDDYLGYGLQLLEIYDSDEEGEDENIN